MGGGGDTEIKETQAEKDKAQVGAERWNDYQDRFVPFENKAISDITGGDIGSGGWGDNGRTGIKEDIVAGRVNSDLARQNNGAIPVGQINRIGQVVASDFTPKMAASGASAMSTAKGAIRDSQIQGMQSVINIGSGQAAGAIDGMGTIAKNAADLVQTDAEQAFNKNSATQSAIAGIVGATGAVAGQYWKPTKA